MARKLKILALVGVTGFFVVIGLVIWAGVSAVGYVASTATEVVKSTDAREQIQNLKTELRGLPNVQALECWGEAQNLFSVEPWLAKPVAENFRNLRMACLEEPRICEGEECSQLKQQINTAEGRTT